MSSSTRKSSGLLSEDRKIFDSFCTLMGLLEGSPAKHSKPLEVITFSEDDDRQFT